MDEFAKRMAELSAKYGPDVVKAPLSAARTDAYSTIASSILGLVVSAMLLVAAKWLWRLEGLNDFDTDINFGKVGGCIMFVVACILCFASVWSLVDPWTWTAIAHPEIYVAKRVMGL